MRDSARCGFQNGGLEFVEDVAVIANLAIEIHQLDGEVDPLGRAVGSLRGKDVLFPQDGRLAVDEKSRPLVVVGDHAIAENDPLAGFQFHLERHCGKPFAIAR